MTDINVGDVITTDKWPDGPNVGVVTRVDKDSVYAHWNGSLTVEVEMDRADVRVVERSS